MNARSTLNLLAVGSLAIISGCSKLVPVEGRVTLDGNPLPGAMVVFYPDEKVELNQKRGPRQANTMTDKEGRFRLQTVNQNGAGPGSYRVTVWKQGVSAEQLPSLYWHRDSTPFQLDVPKQGRKDIELALESKLKITKR